MDYVIGFDELRMGDVARVGGKNASLGEMISQLTHLGVRVPSGFATTAQAFVDFLAYNRLDEKIYAELARLDVGDVSALGRAGALIRGWILAAPLQPKLEDEITRAYRALASGGGTVAVRSSATAEDLPDASFAGQQETYLNVEGIADVLKSVRMVFASLYNDRAISYRVDKGFAHADVALSAGVQKMVRSDCGSSGVVFTLDTESGFDQVVLVTAAYGLGETVVQGQVNPDEFYVYKPALAAGKKPILRRNLGSKEIRLVYADAGSGVRQEAVPESLRRQFSLADYEVEELARFALVIEAHYGRAMDIEWGKDGVDGKIYILQARPETVKSRSDSITSAQYRLHEGGEVLVTGRSIGTRIGAGEVRVVKGIEEMAMVREGDVLVADMTDPDWEPVMKRASAIVTNRGGRTCHAAIVARELGIPAVVGCNDATEVLSSVEKVTVSCAEGDVGKVYRGILGFDEVDLELAKMPEIPLKISMNVGNPDMAFEFRKLPNSGVGLARLEFIIARMIGIHPKAALEYPELPLEVNRQIEEQSAGYPDPVNFYVEKLAEGISTLGAAFWPKPVIVRLSDFKSNEYSSLIGGDQYEPIEENPMIGFRGASRYVAESFRQSFELECRALLKVRDEMGLTNIEVMVPFVRTLREAREVIELLSKNGLDRGKNGLRIVMMCEIPSNALLADDFLDLVDGFSIGSNDLTQLTLGVDRDSGIVAEAFDERDPAVKFLLHLAIDACKRRGKYIGICGQGPSDHPDFALWLMNEGIGSISLNPDTVVKTWLYLESELAKRAKLPS